MCVYTSKKKLFSRTRERKPVFPNELSLLLEFGLLDIVVFLIVYTVYIRDLAVAHCFCL
jgi:hypothetical protein